MTDTGPFHVRDPWQPQQVQDLAAQLSLRAQYGSIAPADCVLMISAVEALNAMLGRLASAGPRGTEAW
jgi:hypothetical protein